MCGIAGIFTLDGQPVSDQRISRMAGVLAHRGPDDQGVEVFDGVGLGHRRLSIFDLSTAGHQPMQSHCRRYWIIFNGEIYNWPEIREELGFDAWDTRTDTETLLQAYVERGPDCLEIFNGMFALAIYDTEDRSLFLARDRLGIKPLLFAVHGQALIFASEAKAIFAGGFPRAVNEGVVYDFLRRGLIDHTAETFFDGIEYLKPGHYMVVDRRKGIRTKKYWDVVDAVANADPIPADDAAEGFRHLIGEAIKLRTRADVPVGVFLSGGIDSSFIAAKTRDVGVPDLCAFTYDFDGSDAGEGEYAAEVADWLGVEHVVRRLAPEDIPDLFLSALTYEEAPITSIRVLCQHALYLSAKENGRTVILEGEGGDQIGGGFEYYWIAVILDELTENGAESGLERLSGFMDMFGIPREQWFRRLFHSLSAYLRPGGCTQDGVSFVKPHLMNRDFLSRHEDRNRKPARLFESHLLNAQQYDVVSGNLPRVLRYTDRASMASSREARVPLLDHNVVEFCFRTEARARCEGTQQRKFMRETARSYLPDSISNRPKQSIVDPQRKWLRDELREWVADTLHSGYFADLDWFDAGAVRREFDAYCREEFPETSFHIFQYLNLAMWKRHAVDDVNGRLERPVQESI